jgi:hypothetical protein
MACRNIKKTPVYLHAYANISSEAGVVGRTMQSKGEDKLHKT